MEGVASLGGPYLGQGGIKQSARLVAWGGEWEASILPRLRTARGNVRALSRAALQIHTWTNPQARKVSDPSVCRRGFLYDPARGWGWAHTPDFTDCAEQRAAPWGGGGGGDRPPGIPSKPLNSCVTLGKVLPQTLGLTLCEWGSRMHWEAGDCEVSQRGAGPQKTP